MSDIKFTHDDPVEDHKFLLTHVLGVDERPWLSGMPDEETRSILLGEAESFFSTVVAPLRLTSDVNGVKLTNGQVEAPAGFVDAYRQLCELGLNAPTVPEALGGAGLSSVFNQFIEEFGASASLAFLMYFGFSTSSCHAISKFGSAELADQVIPRLISGEWLATMALTEPQAGSNLAEVRTTAKANDDGTFSITGDKIFITGGDSDLAENVIHVVLARTEDQQGVAIPGIGGLGVFVVARDDLATGESNGVSVVGIEHKMGLHGGATCSMHFEASRGVQLSPAGKGSAAGMAALFEMMNHARLSTAISAVGVAATAADMTSQYATDRTAGPAAGLPAPEKAHAIIKHPDISRLVTGAWSFVDGARAVLSWGTMLIVEGHEHEDEAERTNAGAIAHLLTPMLKAYVTDVACQVCDDCIQVFGGYGYVRETGVEQLFRDLRASRIYEGANGIQAHDFVMRRMAGKGEMAIDLLVREIRDSLASITEASGTQRIATLLESSLDSLMRVVEYARTARESSPRDLLAVSVDIAHLFGIILLGWRSAVSMVVAKERYPALFERKELLARHWANTQLTMIVGLESRILNSQQ